MQHATTCPIATTHKQIYCHLLQKEKKHFINHSIHRTTEFHDSWPTDLLLLLNNEFAKKGRTAV